MNIRFMQYLGRGHSSKLWDEVEAKKEDSLLTPLISHPWQVLVV